jgi:LysR family transcriptional regulator, benzoate and cis,cis-muconate-responsive activator of ben and cat genes
VSQPALSSQIRDLEDDVGFNLLERTAKSVRLTDAGRVFLEQTRAVLQQVDDAVKTARAVASGRQSELHVGYIASVAAHLLPRILRACQHSIPNVHVKLHEQSNEPNLRDLLAGQLQLAFLIRTTNSPPFRKIRFEELAPLHARLAVAPDHPFAGRRTVSLADAAREPFVAFARGTYSDYHNQFAAVFADIKVKPRIVEEHDDFSSLVSAIETGTGVALVSAGFAYAVGERVKLLRLNPEPKTAVLGIAAPMGRLSPAAEKFWECAKEAASAKSFRQPGK